MRRRDRIRTAGGQVPSTDGGYGRNGEASSLPGSSSEPHGEAPVIRTRPCQMTVLGVLVPGLSAASPS